jgi:O-methyltransferase
MGRAITMDETLYRYLVDHSVREHPVLAELRAETAKLPKAVMQIGPEQGQFMALLARLMGARRCIEIGVFTGYSSLAVALALPENGSIIALDVSEEWTSIARRHWRRAGVEGKIDLRLGRAMDTLDTLISLQESGRFDLAFIDADKGNYLGYYERCLELVRPRATTSATTSAAWSWCAPGASSSSTTRSGPARSRIPRTGSPTRSRCAR